MPSTTRHPHPLTPVTVDRRHPIRATGPPRGRSVPVHPLPTRLPRAGRTRCRRHMLLPLLHTFTTTMPAVVPALPAAPIAAAGSTPGLPDWLTGYTRWVSDLPAHAVWLWHHARA